jgi:hypothetical protein
VSSDPSINLEGRGSRFGASFGVEAIVGFCLLNSGESDTGRANLFEYRRSSRSSSYQLENPV